MYEVTGTQLWRPHWRPTSRQSGQCTVIPAVLNPARSVLPRSVSKRIIEALVPSVVRYCMTVHGGSCTDTQLHRVQNVINSCARVVTGKDDVSTALRVAVQLAISKVASRRRTQFAAAVRVRSKI